MAEIAAESPNKLVRVIVQKTDDSDQAHKTVEAIGGEGIRNLDFINAFVAQIQAKSLVRLTQDQSISQIYLDAPVRSTSLITETVRDDFNVFSYRNNDGTETWLDYWTEFGDGGDGLKDHANGYIKIVNDLLQFKKADRGIHRTAGLTMASVAVLSFDYQRIKMGAPQKYVTLDISADGGKTWTTLDTFGNGKDSKLQPASYDLSAYIPAELTLRFTTSPEMGGKFRVDNLQIEYAYEEGTTGGIFGVVYSVRTPFPPGFMMGRMVWISGLEIGLSLIQKALNKTRPLDLFKFWMGRYVLII